MTPEPIECPYCGGTAEFAIKDHGQLYYWCKKCQRGVAKSPRGRRGARVPTTTELIKKNAVNNVTA